MDEMDTWADVFNLLGQKPRFKRLVESPRVGFTWSLAYELEYKVMLAALLVTIAEKSDLDALGAADDKVEFMLRHVEADDVSEEKGRVRPRRALLALGLLMALIKSADALGTYSVSMNELVARARRGDQEALLRAVRIDPSALSAPSIAHQISLAVMRKDRRLLQKVKKAFDGPHKGLQPYKKLRYSALVLEESGALTPDNRENVFRVVAEQLHLYEQSRGDPFKGLFTQFARWKIHSAT